MVMGMTYVFRSPKFSCTPKGEISVACSQDAYCLHLALGDMEKLEVIFPLQLSVTEEFDLICAREYLVTTAQSMFFAGGLISGYLFSYLSDRLGRR